MKCEKCGAEISEYSRFCGECGNVVNERTDLLQGTDENVVIERINSKKEKNKIVILLAVLIAVVAVAGVAISALIISGNNNSDDNGFSIAETTELITNEPAVTAEPAGSTAAPIIVITTPAPAYQESVSSDTSSYTAADAVQSYMYVVNCDEWISLRASASTSASRITTIPLGAVVGYISNAGNGFYKVSYNGMTGYVLASYLSNTNTSSAALDITMHVVDCDEWISLRESPSTASARLATIPLGASVTYISNAGGGFYKISYNGQVGYALSQYLE